VLLWEVALSVRTLVDPRHQRYHLPWLDEVRAKIADIDVTPLLAIQPMRGYSPDLIAPLPTHARTTAEEQLAQVRATPLDLVREEVTLALTDRDGEPVPEGMRDLARYPRRTRDRIAAALEECWHRLVEPYWPRIRDLLDADVAHHSRLLADGGLQKLLPAISDRITWTGSGVRVATGQGPTVRRDTRGQGLLLQPSAFVWPNLIVVWDERYQPTIVYPARGVAELWQPTVTPVDAALTALFGRTRATLLASVTEPATTTTLARRHGLAAATVSEHLHALARAGLVRRTRTGRHVLYATSPLGDALLRGAADAGTADVG
jgi:DNA-binding transcriptional ArsR family regulator